jgi:glyoxylase-like metal-dependent hydrolase (beta-lactamase superfamily II)
MSTQNGEAGQIAPDLHTVAVPNPLGPSGQPTNVYIAGRDSAILIDAGANDGGATVLAALDRLRINTVALILLTHAHQDHAGSAPALQAATGAQLALHPRDIGIASRWNIDLAVDRPIVDGDIFAAGPYRFRAIATPGHAPGHVSFYEPSLRALFAGDLLSGNGTIAVVPPNGSMIEYLASLRRVRELEVDVIYPGHGPAIRNGNERIEQYIEHRERRARDIRDAIATGYDTLDRITDHLYADVVPRIRPQALGTVHAHVLQLIDEGQVEVVTSDNDLAGSRLGVATAVPARRADRTR